MAAKKKTAISNAWQSPISTLMSAALAALLLKSQGLNWTNAGIAAGITALGGVLPDPGKAKGEGK